MASNNFNGSDNFNEHETTDRSFRGGFQRGGYQPRGGYRGRGDFQPRGGYQSRGRGEFIPRGGYPARGGFRDNRDKFVNPRAAEAEVDNTYQQDTGFQNSVNSNSYPPRQYNKNYNRNYQPNEYDRNSQNSSPNNNNQQPQPIRQYQQYSPNKFPSERIPQKQNNINEEKPDLEQEYAESEYNSPLYQTANNIPDRPNFQKKQKPQNVRPVHENKKFQQPPKPTQESEVRDERPTDIIISAVPVEINKNIHQRNNETHYGENEQFQLIRDRIHLEKIFVNSKNKSSVIYLKIEDTNNNFKTLYENYSLFPILKNQMYTEEEMWKRLNQNHVDRIKKEEYPFRFIKYDLRKNSLEWETDRETNKKSDFPVEKQIRNAYEVAWKKYAEIEFNMCIRQMTGLNIKKVWYIHAYVDIDQPEKYVCPQNISPNKFFIREAGQNKFANNFIPCVNDIGSITSYTDECESIYYVKVGIESLKKQKFNHQN